MLFGTFAQKNYFEYPATGTYEGVIINANMAAHAPAGLAGFLLEKTASTRYIIDPLTHAFQHDPEVVTNDNGEPKSSVMSLAQAYGEPVVSCVGCKPLLPDHLQDQRMLEGFVERCLAFQCEQLTKYMKESDAAKYLESDEVEVHPYAVIAPYFYLTENTITDWFRINVKAAEHAVKIYKGKASKVFASVVISQGLLVNTERQNEIANAFKDIELDGFLLWVDNFDELAASCVELRALLDFGHKLRGEQKKELINLHGSYFSILGAGILGKEAFSGVTHAPEFGEFRGVVPVGGGIPIARYYIPELHARIRYRDALRMFRAKKWLDSADTFIENICNCTECKNTLSQNPNNFVLFGESNIKNINRRGGIVRIDFPTTAAKERCLKHYLQRKKREFDAASNSNSETLLQNLLAGYEKYKDVAGLDGVDHLRSWYNVFNEFNVR